jgi:hypothetical protein
MIRSSGPAIIACAALLTVSCTSPDTDAHVMDLDGSSAVIRWGTSFGMCVGYCRQELEISGSLVKLTLQSWDTLRLPTQVITQPISADAFDQLLKRINDVRIEQLQDVYGCPDCADGGAEWVELESADFKKRVSFEYNRDPARLEVVLAELRAIRSRFPPRQ